MGLTDITKGHLNEIFGFNKELRDERLEICKYCGLYEETRIGPMCSSSKYMDPKTGDVLLFPKTGYVQGCGCRINAKAALKHSKCIIDKW